MLILTQTEGNEIFIDVPATDRPLRIVLQTTLIRGDRVRLGFQADPSIEINRREVAESKAEAVEALFCP